MTSPIPDNPLPAGEAKAEATKPDPMLPPTWGQINDAPGAPLGDPCVLVPVKEYERLKADAALLAAANAERDAALVELEAARRLLNEPLYRDGGDKTAIELVAELRKRLLAPSPQTSEVKP